MGVKFGRKVIVQKKRYLWALYVFLRKTVKVPVVLSCAGIKPGRSFSVTFSRQPHFVNR